MGHKINTGINHTYIFYVYKRPNISTDTQDKQRDRSRAWHVTPLGLHSRCEDKTLIIVLVVGLRLMYSSSAALKQTQTNHTFF